MVGMRDQLISFPDTEYFKGAGPVEVDSELIYYIGGQIDWPSNGDCWLTILSFLAVSVVMCTRSSLRYVLQFMLSIRIGYCYWQTFQIFQEILKRIFNHCIERFGENSNWWSEMAEIREIFVSFQDRNCTDAAHSNSTHPWRDVEMCLESAFIRSASKKGWSTPVIIGSGGGSRDGEWY